MYPVEDIVLRKCTKVFRQIHQKMSKKIWVKDLTEFTIEESQTCQSCNFSKKLSYSDVIFTVDGNPESVEKAIEQKMKDESNKFKHNCPKSKDKVEDEVEVSKQFITKPKVLLIQVNRFKVDKENKVKKIMDKVKIKNKTIVEETFYTLDSTINHEELTNNN